MKLNQLGVRYDSYTVRWWTPLIDDRMFILKLIR